MYNTELNGLKCTSEQRVPREREIKSCLIFLLWIRRFKFVLFNAQPSGILPCAQRKTIWQQNANNKRSKSIYFLHPDNMKTIFLCVSARIIMVWKCCQKKLPFLAISPSFVIVVPSSTSTIQDIFSIFSISDFHFNPLHRLRRRLISLPSLTLTRPPKERGRYGVETKKIGTKIRKNHRPRR